MQLTIAIPIPMLIHALSLVIAFTIGVVVGWVCGRPLHIPLDQGDEK
jgi:hypothetical protein